MLPVERALGVQWCIESDSLQFKIAIQDRPLTRRGILSMVSSVYDPLGFLSPVILPAKQILQEPSSSSGRFMRILGTVDEITLFLTSDSSTGFQLPMHLYAS